MVHRDAFWALEHLSDAQLLKNLDSVLRTQQRALAELVAHLGEVEDRRLHLEAAYGSMFAYCVERWGMSEDEACRRIELARLARKFPALFAELANGQITLSVALVLKPVLSASNHLELLAAARGMSIRQARELVAERFPRPDAPSGIRKLPERRPAPVSDRAPISPTTPSAACPPPPLPASTPLAISATVPLSSAASPPIARAAASSAPTLTLASVESQPPLAAPNKSLTPSVTRNVIEPLSAGRYRIQFTADAALKQQIEQARDLLRHANPGGDFAPIISRALQLLIDDLLRRRFGAGARRTASTPAPTQPAPAPSATSETEPLRPPCAPPTAAAPSTRRSHIPRAARREVLERDGLRCSWVAPDGARCGSQAWLELDHRQPAGKLGSSELDNLRLLCRAHNQLAAEHAYGREHIERAVVLRRRRRQQQEDSLGPPA